MKERNKRKINFKELGKNALYAIIFVLIIFATIAINDLARYNNYKEEYETGEETEYYDNFWEFVTNYTEE